jgi:hypothetical protein
MKDMVVVKFALYALRPNARWYFGENDTIVWLDEKQTEPTDKEINDWIKDTQYQRERLTEYPDLQECIHAILDDDLTALQAKRKLVKDKYPKP